MKKLFFESIAGQLFFLSLVVFLSRLPFIWAGFGVEEDSWLLAITAKNMAETGKYEMSRAPAHPLQEFIYACMYRNGLSAVATNLLSVIASIITTVFFALSLKKIGFTHYLFAAFAFAFSPVVFISSTYTIDYMLAAGFIMGSFYCLLNDKIVFAGILLGIAIGFRITSGIMLVPFCILLFPVSKNTKSIFVLLFVTALIGLLAYIPVIRTYGFSFFTYSDQFPYPHFAKIIYKATIGVFGLIGMLTIIFFKSIILYENFLLKEKRILQGMPAKLLIASCTVILIYLISYLRLPQKSAYFIPAVPFIILLFGYFLSSVGFKLFCVLLTMSSFFFSVNLTDFFRGANHSSLAVKFTLAGQEIFIDPFTGPVFSDYTKRLNKIVYTEEVYHKTNEEQKKIILICGWWYNELQVRMWNCEKNNNVKFVFYINKQEIEKYIAEGYEIYYLPEQNIYNDEYSRMTYTDSVAKLYI